MNFQQRFLRLTGALHRRRRVLRAEAIHFVESEKGYEPVNPYLHSAHCILRNELDKENEG